MTICVLFFCQAYPLVKTSDPRVELVSATRLHPGDFFWGNQLEGRVRLFLHDRLGLARIGCLPDRIAALAPNVQPPGTIILAVNYRWHGPLAGRVGPNMELIDSTGHLVPPASLVVHTLGLSPPGILFGAWHLPQGVQLKAPFILRVPDDDGRPRDPLDPLDSKELDFLKVP